MPYDILRRRVFSTVCNVLSFNTVQRWRMIDFLVFLTPIWSFSVNGIDVDYYDSLKIESLRVLVLFISFRLDVKIKNVSFSSKNHVWWLSFSTGEWHYIRLLKVKEKSISTQQKIKQKQLLILKLKAHLSVLHTKRKITDSLKSVPWVVLWT